MNLRTLIAAEELVARLRRGGTLVVDCRFDLTDPGKGERDHADAHIPGAVYANLDRDLSDLSKPGLGRHPLPDAAAFAASLSRWGWTTGMPIVAYDDANGALAAARLWWLMRLAGHTEIAVLDGGLAAWRAAALPIETGSAQRKLTTATVTFDTLQIVDYDELRDGLAAHSLRLLDARAAPRFRGEVEPIDPVAGHVPGAANRPFSDNLQGDGCFKPAAELRREFGVLTAGFSPGQVVHMCGSGVTACHNLLAVEHAGLAGSRIFAPSWSGWVGDRSRPVATGM